MPRSSNELKFSSISNRDHNITRWLHNPKNILLFCVSRSNHMRRENW